MRRTLAHLRPSSYLINIGRGAIVVLDDLVAALRDGRLAGAALDVYEIEPLPPEHPLWDFPNVILTPHTAGYSPVIAARHLAVLVENVGRFAEGKPLKNVVDESLVVLRGESASWYRDRLSGPVPRSSVSRCGLCPPEGTMPPSRPDEGRARTRHCLYQGRRSELKLDLARPGGGRGSVSGGRGDSRRSMAGGEQGRRPAESRRNSPGAAMWRWAPQYRFCPKDTFPAQVHDVKAAVRWIKSNAKKYQVDPERVGAIGLFGGRAPCTYAGPDEPERRARRRRPGRRSGQPGQGGRQLFRTKRPGRERHSGYLQALGQGLSRRNAHR